MCNFRNGNEIVNPRIEFIHVTVCCYSNLHPRCKFYYCIKLGWIQHAVINGYNSWEALMSLKAYKVYEPPPPTSNTLLLLISENYHQKQVIKGLSNFFNVDNVCVCEKIMVNSFLVHLSQNKHMLWNRYPWLHPSLALKLRQLAPALTNFTTLKAVCDSLKV